MEKPPADPHLAAEAPDGIENSSRNTSCSGTSARRMQSSAAILGGAGGDFSTARMGLYGALSSSAAAVALQPLDVIRTRQVGNALMGLKPPRWWLLLFFIGQQQCVSLSVLLLRLILCIVPAATRHGTNASFCKGSCSFN